LESEVLELTMRKETLRNRMLNHYDENSVSTASLVDPLFSVAAPDYPASNALIGELSCTDSTGVGIYW
jgi:hypothetical protein